MATLMKLKRSAVQGKIPTTAQLELGELSLNTYDGKLYTKKSVSGTESIVPIGGGTGTSAIFTSSSFTATANQTAFVTTAALFDISVFLNGIRLKLTSDYTFANKTVTLVAGLQAGDELEVLSYNTASIVNGVTATYLRNNFTATAGQTVISTSYTAGALDLWLNGIKLTAGTDFTATNGISVTFGTALAVGDEVETIAWNAVGVTANLTDINNIDVSSLANNDILQYNSSTSKWENTTKIATLQAAIDDAELLALAGI